MAVGGAALLAPLFERVAMGDALPFAWIRRMVPALLAAIAVVYGVLRLGPLVYPIAQWESETTTAPFRAARDLGIKHAVVLLQFGRTHAYPGNLAQNPPMNPDPDVLYLGDDGKPDVACIRKHFPGRTWYWAEKEQKLTPY